MLFQVERRLIIFWQVWRPNWTFCLKTLACFPVHEEAAVSVNWPTLPEQFL
jgi:hypothetical protein